MEKEIKIGEHTVSKDGIDGKWRVYWIAEDKMGREMLFRSKYEAIQWAEEMASYEGIGLDD